MIVNFTKLNFITVKDNQTDATEPTLNDAFASYGATAYTIDYWDGAAWVNAATVSGNNKVFRQFILNTRAGSKFRATITAAPDGYGRVAAFEVFNI